jgi:hypothetical protein
MYKWITRFKMLDLEKLVARLVSTSNTYEFSKFLVSGKSV